MLLNIPAPQLVLEEIVYATYCSCCQLDWSCVHVVHNDAPGVACCRTATEYC